MRTNHFQSTLKAALRVVSILPLAAVAAFGQSVSLTAAPATATLPDGTAVPMWGYSCTAFVAPATCAALNPNAAGGWSPVVITVPPGPLTVNLTNNLSFNGGVNLVPTSLTIVGQLGGGLGTAATTAPSPDHTNLPSNNVSWSIAGGPGFTPPAQADRVRSFAGEVSAVAATATPTCSAPAAGTPATGCGTLTWSNLRPGTYLIESGTHPSIQGPMGLYGMLVVTTAPGTTAGTAYPGVSYNAEVPLLLSEIDPVQNTEVSTAVNTAGFSETAVWDAKNTGSLTSANIVNGGCGYNSTTTTGTVVGTGSLATVTLSFGPSPTCPTGTATTGAITGVTFTNGGSGYSPTSPAFVQVVDTSTNPGVGAIITGVTTVASQGCGAPTVHTCYPPAVNYTPLYYLFNGVAFDKTHSSASLFPTSPAGTTATPVAGNVLVRLVNAGLRMHVPSIVGSQTTPPIVPTGVTPASVPGFSLIAEDGNPLPGVSRVQSEVFLAAGKTYDVMIDAFPDTDPTDDPDMDDAPLAVFDRALSLSGNAIARDAGMLAYITMNGLTLPNSGVFASSAKANDDPYNAVIAGTPLIISDPSKGVLANDVNVYGVKVVTGGVACTTATCATTGGGTVALASNGTFTYTPPGTFTSDSFTYCGNGALTGATCATVNLGASSLTSSSTITCSAYTNTASIATYLAVKTPGVLAGCTDTANLPLTVATSPAPAITAGTGTLLVDANGGFTVSGVSSTAVTFSFTATNALGKTGSGSATINFPTASNLAVTVVDGVDKTPITDYRWIIEEDRTFFVDPNCTTNPLPMTCPTVTSQGAPAAFGTNFHTSYMPLVASGCTGPLSCETGQTQAGLPVACDQGNGICRTAASKTAVNPNQVHLDPTKRYYLSVLPGDAAQPFIATYGGAPDCSTAGRAAGHCGHGMGGAPIPALCTAGVSSTSTCVASASYASAPVTVLSQPSPYPTAKLTVFVFQDDWPLNGEHDAGGGVDVISPQEPGLGGFEVTLFDDAGGTGDATGQPTYDMFNMPLTNSLAGTVDPATGNDACPISPVVTANVTQSGTNATPDMCAADPTLKGCQKGIIGMIVSCPKYESDGTTLSPLAGQVVVNNLYPGRYGVVATPGADRIGRGEEWLQTNTLDGQKAHDSFMRIGEPAYFQEFGPAGYHVSIGFANPQIINTRGAENCAAPAVCNNELKAHVTTARMSRPPDERLYGSGTRDGFAFTQCYAALGDPDGAAFAFVKCDDQGNFDFKNLPDGNFKLTIFDQWNDQIVDGISTPIGFGGSNPLCPGAGSTATLCNMGEIAAHQWQSNIYTTTFFDANGNGVRDNNETGLALVATNNRFRDGSYSNFNNTDLNGYAGFNEIFPLFSWYVIETYNTRFKTTGVHVVYDTGGPVDGSSPAGTPCAGSTINPCGNSNIAQNFANTYESYPLPADLSLPGAVYCASGADCNTTEANSFAAGTPVPSSTSNHSSGRIDPPNWFGSYAWQGFSGQNIFLEFGKKPYAEGETGGIQGEVIYASTRPFDDPQQLIHTSWTPDVPNVTVNLYQEGTATDGVTQTLKLVDTTQTSSFDAWAQGFRRDASGNIVKALDGTSGVPNINCPGQQPGPTLTTPGDLYFFGIQNQPNYFDWYNSVHGGPAVTALPYQSQYKCYDGMHNWNQAQPVPYDGMYSFPSVTSYNPTTGKPAGTMCHMKTDAEPWGCIPNPDSTDPWRAGTPMLAPGKYVVEVVVPPGYELVKEEDKNILIGDNYIAPPVQQFGGLGGIYILPDQASVAAAYNANNAQNPTQGFGRATNMVSHEGDTGSVEETWPCVGAARIVPDYISLFPQSHEVAPFAGATRNLCDRKEVTLNEQTSALAKFWIFTPTHTASHFTGVITDDFTSEFDPFSPQFGEKFAPAFLPVSIKDWAGNEVSRVYSDMFGAYNGLSYSTWEVNPPNPTGYGPTMMVVCMNDAGSGTTPDPLFQPGYSQFCYELPFMPAQTGYFDTPVVPTSAFSEGYNHPDCNYPDATPAISEVDGQWTSGSGVGPWVPGGSPVASVAVTSPGSGYTPPLSVSFTGGGGSGAAGTATMRVVGINVTNPGAGYTSRPGVTIAAPGGTGNTTATVANSGVTLKVVSVSFTQNTAGTCTTGAHNVTFSGGGQTVAATATATVTLLKLTAITVNTGGAYTGVPTVAVSNCTGLTNTAKMGVGTITVSNGGSGYTAVPSVTIANAPTGTGNSNATATAVMGINAIAVTSGGSYASAPTVTVTGATGSGAAATATLGASAGPAAGSTLKITALGDQQVDNYGYSGPQVDTSTSMTGYPWAKQKVTRHYGFGATQGTGSVTIGGINASVTSWSDTSITVTVPSGVPACAVQQQLQYGGSAASCGQLVITAANGKQSVDTVTVTIGGKAPTHVLATDTIQSKIDAASPGDLIIVDPTPLARNELLLMWKPIRLQGVGAASSIINANTQPAGKMDPWRKQVNCLFGLTPDGLPNPTGAGCPVGNDPAHGYASGGPNYPGMIVDRVPMEGILGWDTTVNGNLAEQLIEPSLMGAYEGAAITVLGKGVLIPAGAADVYGSGAEAAFPAGSTLLDGTTNATTGCGPNTTAAHNPYPTNFYCNPSSIDGLSLINSSQGGGGIFVHAWGHNIQISNNRVHNNTGTLSGGITVGQGEHVDLALAGADPLTVIPPGSCETAGVTNQGLPYCYNMHVNVHHNKVTLNSSMGDELFSSTPAGAGGVSFCNGADYYRFQYNWVCGNLSTGDGGGVAHIGFSKNGTISNNSILFNQSTNPTITTNGGGLLVMGAPDPEPPCGTTTDQDCVATPGSIPPGDGTGPGLVINANLIVGNSADSGSGGGLRLQHVNGTDVINLPNGSSQCPNLNFTGATSNCHWNSVTVTNNIITNNVAGWDGGGVSLQDALAVNIVNNTIASNDSTASSGVLFQSLFAPLASTPGTNCTLNGGSQSCPQVAGLVSVTNSTVLTSNLPNNVTCPTGHGTTGSNGSCIKYSVPLLANNVIWQNRSYFIGVGDFGTGQQNQQKTVTLYNSFTTTPAPSQSTTGACTAASYWDIGVRGDTGPANHSVLTGTTLLLSPTYSVLTDAVDYPGANNLGSTNLASQYCNGSRVPPELGSMGYLVYPGTNEVNALPTPVFSLTPAATVDEGNNWINMRWGPLALANPKTGATLGNYALAAGAPGIDAIPSTSTTYALAPTTDFFGKPRPDVDGDAGSTKYIDIGAIEFQNSPVPSAPTLTSIVPNSGVRGNTVAVTLNGANLIGATAVTVSGSGVTCTITGTTATTVAASCAIAANAGTGNRNVAVITRGGTSNNVTFTVNNPPLATVTNVTPATFVRGTTTTLVAITGTNFTTTGTTFVANPAAGITISAVTVTSPTAATATFAIASGTTAALGAHTITANNPGGTGTAGFAIGVQNTPLATVTNVNPAAFFRGTTTTSVAITGTNFVTAGTTFVATPAAGVTISAVTVTSPTSATATFAFSGTAALGPYTITANNPGPGTVGFTITLTGPTITGIAPASGAQGTAGLAVTITGTGLAGTTAVTVSGLGVTCPLAAPAPTDTTVNVTCSIVNLLATTGAKTLTVTTPTGAASGTFTVLANSFTPRNALFALPVPSLQTGTTTPHSGTLTFTNGGTAPFTPISAPTVNKVGATGGTFSIGAPTTCAAGVAVAVGGTCTITVLYTPGTAGTAIATAFVSLADTASGTLSSYTFLAN